MRATETTNEGDETMRNETSGRYDDVETLRPDQYVDRHGKVRRRRGQVPACECCGARAMVLMEIGHYRDDWIIRSCDRCGNNICQACGDSDDDGNTTCVDCLATDAVRGRDPAYLGKFDPLQDDPEDLVGQPRRQVKVRKIPRR